MESKNHKIIRNFISDDEVKLIIDWISSLNHIGNNANHHLNHLSKSLMGKSFIFNISKTHQTTYITKFQSISDVSEENVPDFIINIIDRISIALNLPKDHLFLQAVDMNRGGRIEPHYDAAVDGFINYKCNLSVFSDDYIINIGEEKENIRQKDLYSFEASLYKHWTDEFKSRRVFLSFGFMVPYHVLKRSESDPRIRLSKRIEKYFQKSHSN